MMKEPIAVLVIKLVRNNTTSSCNIKNLEIYSCARGCGLLSNCFQVLDLYSVCGNKVLTRITNNGRIITLMALNPSIYKAASGLPLFSGETPSMLTSMTNTMGTI